MSAQPNTIATDAFERDGFLVIPRLIDPVTLRRMRNGFDKLVGIARTLTHSQVVHNTQFVIRRDPFALARAVWCSGAAPELQLGHHRPTLDLACDALDTDEPVQIIQQAHIKLPGDGVAFRWHQDASNRRYGSELWRDVNGNGSFIQVAVALDPVDANNGGLSFVPGSHRRGFIADPNTGALPRVDTNKAVTPALNPGDAVAFGPFVVHGSRANTGSTVRRLFLQGFASPGANRRVYPGCGTGITRTRR